MKNILITSVGKRVVLVEIFVKTIKQLGIDAKLFTTDMKPEMAPAGVFSEECISVPKCSEPSFIDSIIKICIQKNIGVIIPTIDPELQVFSENRPRFNEIGVKIMLSDNNIVKVCRDKRKTALFFNELGIAVPRILDKYHPRFPMFAKPYDGSLSTNIHYIKNADALTKEILDDPKLLFMEYIDKNEYKEFTVDMYYGLDHHVKSIVPRERVEIRAGEINKGITRKNYIVDFLKERMECLPGVRGCVCVQLFYRESDHDIKGIEINPRFGGGYPMSYHAGANYAEYVILEYLMDKSVEYSDKWLDNTVVLRYDRDVVLYNKKLVAFDLDDTLYKEVDYLKSAFREIAETTVGRDSVDNVFNILFDAWQNNEDAFDELINRYELDISKNDLLTMYRQHIPNIVLDQDVIDTLDSLKEDGAILCLITDGRSITQRNKIQALGLSRYFDLENILISEEIGYDKHSPEAFKSFEDKYPNVRKFYVGDNLEKDFYWPNRMGWTTIYLEDDGRNIHSPMYSESVYKQANYSVKQMKDIINIIKSYNGISNDMNNVVMKKIAIYGAGGLGREVAGGIERINQAGTDSWEFVGFYDDRLEKGSQVSHYGTVLGGMDDLNRVNEPLALAIAVGTPETRKKILERISNPNISFPNLIAPSFRVLDSKTFKIGKGNIIQDSCSVTCDVTVGDYNVLNGSNVLGHDVRVGSFNVLMPGVRLSGEVSVGDGNLFGVDSVILQRIKVGDGITLGAGSVLMTKPKDGFTYIGVPAKKFDYE